MINEIFSIYDAATEAYNTPIYVPNEMVAMRMFRNLCEDPNSQVSRNPEDFTLFRVGSFDTDSGYIQNLEVQRICTGRDIANVPDEYVSPPIQPGTVGINSAQ